MKKVRALDLYFLYDQNIGEYKFYCGKTDSKQLIDLKGQTKINNDKEKLAQKSLYLSKVWNEYSFVEDHVFATLSASMPTVVKQFLIQDISKESMLDRASIICEVSKFNYDADKLQKFERSLNKGLEL